MAFNNNILCLLALNFLFHFVESDTSNCTNVYIENFKGTITSPNYPNKYPDFTSCSWFINIPKQFILTVSILDLNIEADDSRECGSSNEKVHCCIHNWLSVPIATQLHTSQLYCGNRQVQSFELPDSLKIASIKFHSSKNKEEGRGFKLKYAITPKRPESCTQSQFQCSTGEQCIEEIRRCDGIVDCHDKSDEHNCAQRCIASGLSSCPDSPHVCYNVSSGFCARLSSCPETSEGEWIPCKNGRSCVRGEQLCDKIVDCDDKSDEVNCDPSSAREVIFMCDNWKWVPSSKVCDGNDDCGDHSDEDGCVQPSFETAIILGSLSCSLLFILLASYIFHAHYHHQHRGHQQSSSMPRRVRPLLNINSQGYIMPYREPPPPYPMDPPPNRRRYRRHRRHTRLSPPTDLPPTPVPLDESTEPVPEEQAPAPAWKAPDEQQEEGATSTD